MINKANQLFNQMKNPGGRDQSRRRDPSRRSSGARKGPDKAGKNERGSEVWIPFASFCTTGQFMDLENGYKRHCSPTAVVNIVRTLERRADRSFEPNKSSDEMFLQFAEIGRRTRIYWNKDVLGYFGGTSNFLTGIFVRSCLRAVGLNKSVSVRFHPWITADAVERALEKGSIVLLQVYRHPKYKNHHMLCYACRTVPADADQGTAVDASVRRAKDRKKSPGSNSGNNVGNNSEIISRNDSEIISGNDSGNIFKNNSGNISKNNSGNGPIGKLPAKTAGKQQKGREEQKTKREFLLADGWKPGPLWVDEASLGHGHFLTIRPV